MVKPILTKGSRPNCETRISKEFVCSNTTPAYVEAPAESIDEAILYRLRERRRSKNCCHVSEEGGGVSGEGVEMEDAGDAADGDADADVEAKRGNCVMLLLIFGLFDVIEVTVKLLNLVELPS